MLAWAVYSAWSCFFLERTVRPLRLISLANCAQLSWCFFTDFHAGRHSILPLLMSRVPSFMPSSFTSISRSLRNNLRVELDAYLVGHGKSPLHGRTLRVTELRQDRPTITLEPNAASVHPIVRPI